ncbi:alkylhydroperoxidase like protein, AhpD family [Methanoregula boonei 6A8]|jgi:AhpD family alkylhydroperoxidase|uniref:Alkylhydroperoxidase like protein, AhpD family n=1 Tax=Methanoregula boonei (strain DSM 21154 / JCM 14090 / 6A8) TaxID=456442 RepID=A7IB44_METB6|nr:carboxymuconolactone decarboxylase family protein [Methanoregula boonei]ABS56955.1 alkylhydroperoxidase like protein, AhpD family [Methanoregula boonei 6A8]
MGRRQEDEFEDRLKKIVDQGAGATADEWLKIIEREYGKVPLIFQRMGERPEVLISHLLYKSSVAETSSLDPKYVELISMAVGAALKCQYCTSYHMQAAARMGATRDEILEVILLSGMISNSSVLANAYRVVDEKLEKCFPCEVKAVPEKTSVKKSTRTGRKKK